MAFCPKCKAEMELNAVRCDACGYDFPPASVDNKRGLAYSPLADLALVVGCLVAGLSAILALVGMVIQAMAGNYIDAFVSAPIVFFLSTAMLVVFLRTIDFAEQR